MGRLVVKFQHLTTFDRLYKLLLWSSAVPGQIYYSTHDNEAIMSSGTAKDQKPGPYDYLKVLANFFLAFQRHGPGITILLAKQTVMMLRYHRSLVFQRIYVFIFYKNVN